MLGLPELNLRGLGRLAACEEFFQALQVNGHYELVQAVGDTNDAYRAAFNKAYFLRENSELLISTRIIGKYNWDWWYYGRSRFDGGCRYFGI